MGTRTRKITNAFDAYWFLFEHPKLNCRYLVQIKDSSKYEKHSLTRLVWLKDVADRKPYKGRKYPAIEYGLEHCALEENLDIFYTKVDSKGVVNDDRKLNQLVQCWLELGPLKYRAEMGKISLDHYHDGRLDCGAATFDEALVKLARLVLKHYGDYQEENAGA